MSWYMTPAIIGLIVKLIVLLYAWKKPGNSDVFICLVTVFCMHNMSELLLFMQYSPDFVMRFYYVTTTGVMGCVTAYSIDVSRIKNNRLMKVAILFCGIIITALILLTNLVIAGFEPTNLALTAIRGQEYWIFQVSALASIIGTLFALIYGYNNTEDPKTQIQCTYALLSLMPLILASATILGLMAAGFNLNAMVILPIASTLLVLITLKTENKHNLSDIRRFLPYSHERRVAQKLIIISSTYTQGDKPYRDAVNEMEKVLVDYSTKKASDNITKTADLMQIPRPTVYAIRKRLGLNAKSDKKKDKSGED